jgi:hypothetical protein
MMDLGLSPNGSDSMLAPIARFLGLMLIATLTPMSWRRRHFF